MNDESGGRSVRPERAMPGRPSSALVKVSIVWLLIGATWVLFPSVSRAHGIAWSPLLSMWVGAGLWWASGLAALAGAWRPRWRARLLPAALFAPLFLAGSFAVSAVIALLPDEWVPGGRGSAIITSISYGALWLLAAEAVREEAQ